MNAGILLVEDNPISREFLRDALLGLDMAVDTADTLQSAIALATSRNHDLFLCDVHLPDAGPGEIFASLRQLHARTPIVAITAETGPTARVSLGEIGYLEIWQKPIEMRELQKNVMRLLDAGNAMLASAIDTARDAVLWDEAAALRAVGNNHATLKALRNMFLGELHRQAKTIEEAFENSDLALLKSECHKLLAGCGFVGAIGLGQAVLQLSRHPDDGEKKLAVMREAEKYYLAY